MDCWKWNEINHEVLRGSTESNLHLTQAGHPTLLSQPRSQKSYEDALSLLHRLAHAETL